MIKLCNSSAFHGDYLYSKKKNSSPDTYRLTSEQSFVGSLLKILNVNLKYSVLQVQL